MSWLNIIFLIWQIIAIIAVIHVIMDNRQPAKTMAWAMVIWFVPVVGFCVARSDTVGNAKTSICGTSNWYRLPAFFMYMRLTKPHVVNIKPAGSA